MLLWIRGWGFSRGLWRRAGPRTGPKGLSCQVGASGIARVSIREMMPDLAPMIVVLIVVLAMITYWAGLVMWLPGYLG